MATVAALPTVDRSRTRFGPVPVPKLWPESTIVCLGSGPSLTKADVDACRSARVIAIKNTIELAPWADVLYGSGWDAGGDTWWSREGPKLTFPGLRYTLDERARVWASVLNLDLDGEGGLSLDPSSLRSGGHSGFQAINLAVHLGAKRVVLLGYDTQPTPTGKDHYFGSHPHGVRPPYHLFQWLFPTIVEPLQALGVTVINASRETALTCFPRMTIQEALTCPV